MFINNSMRAGSLRFFDTPLLAAGFFIENIFAADTLRLAFSSFSATNAGFFTSH